jgi:hypothetical protein
VNVRELINALEAIPSKDLMTLEVHVRGRNEHGDITAVTLSDVGFVQKKMGVVLEIA